MITMPNGGQGCADSAQVAACLANAFQGIQCLDIGTEYSFFVVFGTKMTFLAVYLMQNLASARVSHQTMCFEGDAPLHASSAKEVIIYGDRN